MDVSGCSRIDENGTLFIDVKSDEFCVDVTQIKTITLVGVEELKTERDHYKAESERFRKALENIQNECMKKDWLLTNIYDIAQEALQGDEE